MGNVGDYWRARKADARYKRFTGLWPGQKFCMDCGRAFDPVEPWHGRCPRCHRRNKKTGKAKSPAEAGQ